MSMLNHVSYVLSMYILQSSFALTHSYIIVNKLKIIKWSEP
jgi:hypothetical protein